MSTETCKQVVAWHVSYSTVDHAIIIVPDDPAGSVIVEMNDEEGYTVWSADFQKDELVCIFRPEN